MVNILFTHPGDPGACSFSNCLNLANGDIALFLAPGLQGLHGLLGDVGDEGIDPGDCVSCRPGF